MSNLPNVISVIRLILSICLLISEPFKIQFWCIYLACGASDMLDGHLARKFNVVSNTGAILDSLGDMAFAVVMVVLILLKVSIPTWGVIWIAVIVTIKLFSILVGYFKFHAYLALHTYANKSLGLLLFIGLPFCIIWNFGFVVVLLFVIATLVAVEELLIILTSKKIERNIKSIFTLISKTQIK